MDFEEWKRQAYLENISKSRGETHISGGEGAGTRTQGDGKRRDSGGERTLSTGPTRRRAVHVISTNHGRPNRLTMKTQTCKGRRGYPVVPKGNVKQVVLTSIKAICNFNRKKQRAKPSPPSWDDTPMRNTSNSRCPVVRLVRANPREAEEGLLRGQSPGDRSRRGQSPPVIPACSV